MKVKSGKIVLENTNAIIQDRGWVGEVKLNINDSDVTIRTVYTNIVIKHGKSTIELYACGYSTPIDIICLTLTNALKIIEKRGYEIKNMYILLRRYKKLITDMFLAYRSNNYEVLADHLLEVYKRWKKNEDLKRRGKEVYNKLKLISGDEITINGRTLSWITYDMTYDYIHYIRFGCIGEKYITVFDKLYDIGWVTLVDNGLTYIYYPRTKTKLYKLLGRKRRRCDELVKALKSMNKNKIEDIINLVPKIVKILELIRENIKTKVKPDVIEELTNVINNTKNGWKNRLEKLGVEIAQALI